MSRYFVRREGRRLGPFTVEELSRLAGEGALLPESLLEEEGAEGQFTAAGLGLLPESALPAASASGQPVGPGRAMSPSPAAGPTPPPSDAPGTTLPWPTIITAAWSLLIALASIYALTHSWTPILDWVNLLMHEAGHMLFSFFGRFLHILGGTLLQLAIPALTAIIFLREKHLAGAQFGLFWSGQALHNVSIYVGDARARILPLLGNDPAGHDWHNLLKMLGVLPYDRTLAALGTILAAIICAAAVFLPVILKRRIEPGWLLGRNPGVEA